jgi:hypothetical protein
LANAADVLLDRKKYLQCSASNPLLVIGSTVQAAQNAALVFIPNVKPSFYWDLSYLSSTFHFTAVSAYTRLCSPMPAFVFLPGWLASRQ